MTIIEEMIYDLIPNDRYITRKENYNTKII